MNIAVFMGGLQFDSQRKMAEGLWKAAREDGNNVYLFASEGSSSKTHNNGEYTIYHLADFSKFDGIILYSETIYDEDARNYVISEVRRNHLCCVSVDHEYPDMINVGSDNWDVMQEITTHLIKVHNVKTVNYIAGPLQSRDDGSRRAAFMEVMRRHELTVARERMYYGNYQARSGREAVAYYESNGLLDADAYICANDQMALGVYYALKERGIRVPDDAILTGFDNIFMARNHTPRLTTTDRNERDLGYLAYRTLINFLKGEHVDRYRKIPSTAIFGESCGCSACVQDDVTDALNYYARTRLNHKRYSSLVNDTAVALTSVTDLDGFLEIAKSAITQIDADEFYLCLNGLRTEYDLDKDAISYQNDRESKDFINQEYPALIDLEVVYRDKRFQPCSIVRKGDILPKWDKVGKKGCLNIISPLHYQERNFGYTVICNSELPMGSEYYHMLLMNISSALENLHKNIELKRMIRKLDDMWVYDALTRIHNRAGFFKEAPALVKKAKEEGKNLFFLFLDLDNLKKANDERGHEAGDKMICAMAQVLKTNLRPGELLMRYGGDEFVAFGMDYDERMAEEYIRNIRVLMEEYNANHPNECLLDASIGYHLVSSEEERPLTSLIEIADQRMYEEKRRKHAAALKHGD